MTKFDVVTVVITNWRTKRSACIHSNQTAINLSSLTAFPEHRFSADLYHSVRRRRWQPLAVEGDAFRRWSTIDSDGGVRLSPTVAPPRRRPIVRWKCRAVGIGHQRLSWLRRGGGETLAKTLPEGRDEWCCSFARWVFSSLGVTHGDEDTGNDNYYGYRVFQLLLSHGAGNRSLIGGPAGA